MSLSPMTTDQPSRLLCVFAHPDDEVFCAGETLAQWVAAGGEAMVLSATRGEAGQIQDAHVASRRTLGAAREQELRDACAQLGVQQVECLDYADGTLQEIGELTLARDIVAYINSYRPDVVITFGPEGGYGHPDHIAISAATTRACQMLARAGRHAPRLYYSVFPSQHRLLCHSLATWLIEQRQDARFRGADAFVRALTLLVDEATELHYADDAVATQWYPAGFSIVEQGEVGASLYLIVSGQVELIHEDADGSRQVIERLGAGQFFGEQALARQTRYETAVVAAETVTCLTLSVQAATAFEGRGEDARLVSGSHAGHPTDDGSRLGEVDTTFYFDRKVQALAAHRSQFAFDATMFPATLLRALLGHEHFEQVSFFASSQSQLLRATA